MSGCARPSPAVLRDTRMPRGWAHQRQLAAHAAREQAARLTVPLYVVVEDRQDRSEAGRSASLAHKLAGRAATQVKVVAAGTTARDSPAAVRTTSWPSCAGASRRSLQIEAEVGIAPAQLCTVSSTRARASGVGAGRYRSSGRAARRAAPRCPRRRRRSRWKSSPSLTARHEVEVGAAQVHQDGDVPLDVAPQPVEHLADGAPVPEDGVPVGGREVVVGLGAGHEQLVAAPERRRPGVAPAPFGILKTPIDIKRWSAFTLYTV